MARRGGSLTDSNCKSIENDAGHRVDFELEKDKDGKDMVVSIEVYDYDTVEREEMHVATLYPYELGDGSEGWCLEKDSGEIAYFDRDGFRCDEDGEREYATDSLATELGFDADTFDAERDLSADRFEEQEKLDKENEDAKPDKEQNPDKEQDPDKDTDKTEDGNQDDADNNPDENPDRENTPDDGWDNGGDDGDSDF